MTLDLRHLRHLLALADHGSFGRAATALQMTQPALSRSLQALEKTVGTTLFDRSKAGVAPTDEGRLLIQRARDLVTAADELDREVSRRRQVQGAGGIVVGCGPYPAETVMPAALARFTEAAPLVRVRLVLRDWDELLAKLRARELDFFVAETSTLLLEPDLEIEQLKPHPVFFMARRGHPLTQRASIRPEDVFAYPFLSVSRLPPRTLEPMLAALRDAEPGVPGRPFPAVEFASLAGARRIAEQSDALVALPLAGAAAEIRRRSLVIVNHEPWMTLGYGIVRLKGHATSAAALRFREFVRDAEASVVREEQRLGRSRSKYLPSRDPA